MRMLQHAHSSPGVLLMAIGADVLHLLTVYWIGAETRVGRLNTQRRLANGAQSACLGGRRHPRFPPLERHTRKQIRP